MRGSVTISENGRSGGVRYTEGFRSIEGDWEFGGGDVVAIVGMGSRADWERDHRWAVARRASILQRVAEEVVRQRAPTCSPAIDEERGEILLREGSAGAAADRATTFVRRYRDLRSTFAAYGLVATLVVGALLWAGRELLYVAPASGVPLGECVRTDRHVAALIQATDPHPPRVTGRGGDDTTSISVLLIPLDGSPPRLVPVAAGLESNEYALARILGSDGHTLWLDVAGLHGVALRDFALITSEELAAANPGLDPSWWTDPRGMDLVDGRLHAMRDDRSAAIDLDPATRRAIPAEPKPSKGRFDRVEVVDRLAAGFEVAQDVWLGLHSPSELEEDFAPESFVRPVERAEDAKQLRRLFRGALEAGFDADHRRIRSIEALRDDEYLNAAFLRLAPESAPVRLADPAGALMIHTSVPGLDGTLVVSRVDLEGRVVWSVDTGLDRFLLQQILPGEQSLAFVGTAPPVPDVLSEPFVLLVDTATGATTRHSLWR